MMKDIKIQSIGDLITNSSTEVFTIIDEGTITAIKDVVKVLMGEEFVDKFDYYLDYCEMIEERMDEILEILEDEGFTLPDGLDDLGSKDEGYFAWRVMKSSVPETIWRYHYKDEWIELIEKAEPLPDILKAWCDSELINTCDNLNENHEWKMYPSILIVPKDKDDKHLLEVAGKLAHLPFLCNHEASYC